MKHWYIPLRLREDGKDRPLATIRTRGQLPRVGETIVVTVLVGVSAFRVVDVVWEHDP